jgi:PKD repeat protein
LPTTAIDSSYFIVIKHRNSIETWSANSQRIIPIGSNYNFTTSANKAYGNNMRNMGSGVYAIYTGDITQDGSIDFNDYPDLDIGSNNGDLGYFTTDLNGDASVDFNDYPTLDINSNDGIIAIVP